MLNTFESRIVLTNPRGEALVRKTPNVCGGDACIRKPVSWYGCWSISSVPGCPAMRSCPAIPALLLWTLRLPGSTTASIQVRLTKPFPNKKLMTDAHGQSLFGRELPRGGSGPF